MRWRPRPPDRWRALAAEAAKFGAIGGVNLVLNLAVFNLLLPIGALKANVVATGVAVTSAYLMNRHWTYRGLARSSIRREYSLFFGFNLVGLFIELAILFAVDYLLGFDRESDVLAFNLAKFAGLAVGTLFRFWAYRTFVFRAVEPRNRVRDAEPAPAESLGGR